MGFAKSADQVAGLIKKTYTLEEIYEDIQNDNEIALSELAPPSGERVLPTGGRSPFMFIGQNPSSEDEELNLWIEQICGNLNLKKNDIYHTNALKFPVEGDDDPYFKDGKAHIKKFFYREVYVVKPEIIFVMGDWSQKLFEKMFHFEFEENTLSKITMKLKIDKKEIEYETYVYPIYHPSYVAKENDFSLYEKQLEPVRDMIKEMVIDWKFVHLHVHNSYSFKDGVGTPETRIQWAIENGKPAVATSNHGNIGDWLTMYNGCNAKGLKPVLGCEIYFNRYAEELRKAVKAEGPEAIRKRKELRKPGASHITMFARNLDGYYNLIKIHNDAWVNGFYMFPYASPDVIKKSNKGVTVLSGCSGAEQNKILSQKFYLQSDQRKEDIEKLINNKVKAITGLFKTKNDEKYSSNEYLDENDFKYYYDNQEEKFNKDDYTQFAADFVEKSDKQQVDDADKKARTVIKWWHKLFGENYYIELMVIDYEIQILINQELIKIAKEENIPVVLTNDAHYLTEGGAKVQELQMLNNQDKTFDQLENDVDGKIWTIKSNDLYYKSVSELKESWEKNHKSDIFTEEVFWESINNAIKIVDDIEKFEIDKGNKLPKLYENSISVLAKKVAAGMKKRGLLGKKEYEDRAAYELKIIVAKGFTDYFIIMEDIMKWTKDTFGRFSAGAGRGSAAGSLVNYVLEITDVDPLKHDLLFERFLDISRSDAVDIDSDFEPRIRDAVIDYMVKRFGEEYVSAIGTYGITRTKVAIQDTARVFGIPPGETIGLTKNVLSDIDDDASLEELENEYPELKAYFDKWAKEGKDLRYFVKGIRNSHRQISQHAAGVLVSSDKLMENVALVKARKRIVTAWQEGSDYHELSDLGYYKYDILGLNNLQVVNDAHALVKKRRKIDIDWDALDLDEEFTYKNVVHGHDHFGVFQYECLDKDVIIEGKTIEQWYEKGKPDYLTSYDEETGELIKNECLAVVKSGKKKIYEIELEDGTKIRSSSEHKFLTKNGWKALKELTEEDELLHE